MTPLTFFKILAAGMSLGCVVTFALGIYNNVRVCHRRFVFKDSATWWDKTRATTKYVVYESDWRNMPGVVARGAAIFGVLTATLTLLIVGGASIFL